MTRRFAWIVAAALLAVVTWSRAASQFDFGRWMRTIDQRSVSVQRHLAAREADAARADARELTQLYAQMERYFERELPAADAAQMSRDGRRQADAIHALLDAGDFDAAAGEARALARACNDCHDPYKPFSR